MSVESVQNIHITNSVETTAIKPPDKQVTEPQQAAEEFKLTNEPKRLEEAVEHANKALEGSNRHFEYEVHQPTKQVVISVVDDNSKEVIRQIPAKKLLDAIAGLMELAGLLVDERR